MDLSNCLLPEQRGNSDFATSINSRDTSRHFGW